MKFAYVKDEIIFPQSLLNYLHDFSPLRDTRETLAEASELFTHTVFQFVVFRKTAPSEFIFYGVKKLSLEGAKSGL
jgi:hypothetical protein